MKHLFGLIIPLLCLHLSCVNSTSKIDKACIVADQLMLKSQDISTSNISFYITLDSTIKFQVYFVGKNEHTDNDLLILKPDGGKLQRKRDDKATADNITLVKTIPLGWNTVTINVLHMEINIGNFYVLKDCGYNINKISVFGKYLVKCTEGTPMWEIGESSDTHIPLTGLSSFGITLSSHQSFLPNLTIDNINIPLSYDEGLFVGKTSLKLPPDNYHFEVVKHSDMKYIFETNIKNASKLLMSANTKEDFMDLNVSSYVNDFILTLHLFQKYRIKVKPKFIIEDPELSPHATESQTKDNSSSAWKIIISVSFVFIGVLISIIYIAYKTKKYRHTDSGIEEGTFLLMNKTQVQVKDTIRATNTESHGENNQQMKPHVKEICKIKLKSDETISPKKKVGELENNKPTKVILVVGQTGSGKSSFINAMLNFIYGVVYEDSYRFKLIDDMDKQNTAGTNNTDEITSYYIPYMSGMEHNCNYIFVDTPGFGDSRGINEDKKWNNKFQEFLNENPNISEVDGICFVVKAAFTRMTSEAKYIIDGLFSMFGRDIKKNIYVVVSFSDGADTNVPELLEKSGLDYEIALKFNSNGLYNEKEFKSKSSKYIDNYFVKKWELTMKNIDNLFKLLKNTSAVSLSLTSVVLEENQDINKLKDELLKLMAMEHDACDQEIGSFQSRIEQNQELLMMKLDEAQKLAGRLKTIPCKENPLVFNEYIDILILNEKDQMKISEMKKLKDRNTAFQKFLNKKNTTKGFLKYIFGEKTEKTE